MTAHFIDYSMVYTLTHMHWETPHACDSLYCDLPFLGGLEQNPCCLRGPAVFGLSVLNTKEPKSLKAALEASVAFPPASLRLCPLFARCRQVPTLAPVLGGRVSRVGHLPHCILTACFLPCVLPGSCLRKPARCPTLCDRWIRSIKTQWALTFISASLMSATVSPSHLMLTAILGHRPYYYSHFPDEEAGA